MASPACLGLGGNSQDSLLSQRLRLHWGLHASPTSTHAVGSSGKGAPGGASLRGKVALSITPRLRHEDKSPLHYTWPEDLRPFSTGMAEPLRIPIFHIADILGRSTTIATAGPQRNIRRAGVGPEQNRYDPGPRMGIDFTRLPPREGKATPGFLWREAKQRASRSRIPPVVHAHSNASSAPSQARVLYPGDSGIPRGLPDMPPYWEASPTGIPYPNTMATAVAPCSP